MRPQNLGRRDRLFNRAAWDLAVSKRERPALGRFGYSLPPQCWRLCCGADKIGYPRFHPTLLLGHA